MFELVFLTSNNEKLAHANHLSKDYLVTISKQKNYGISYEEPRILDRQELIKQSIKDASERWKKNVSSPEKKFFFIEDTSVIIEAISSDSEEVPGVDIKYWMKENSFSSMDQVLKDHNNNRKVKVRSDIVLYLPDYYQNDLGITHKIFTSFSEGTITEKEYNVKTNALYPWLSAKTFNKWFIPSGAQKPISMLSLKEADKYDFRKGAFEEMLEFLERLHAIRKKNHDSNPFSFQIPLGFKPHNFIIVGPTCAGKSTLAEFLSKNFRYYYIEASDYMHLQYYRTHGTDSQVEIVDFAKKALKDNPSIVSNEILKTIKELDDIPVVITGFRHPDEIKTLLNNYSGYNGFEVLVVSASESIRYERSKIRNRKDVQEDLAHFIDNDKKQLNMGLEKIIESHKNNITNERSFNEYYNAFLEMYHQQFGNRKRTNDIYNLDHIIPKVKSLEDTIIITLFTLNETNNDKKYYTTTELSHLIKTTLGVNKNKNNISRYFNQNYHPYYEILKENSKNKYRISQSGLGRAKYLLSIYN